MNELLNRLKALWAVLKNYIGRLDHAKRKRLIGGIVAIALVLGLAMMPMLAATKDLNDGPESTLMTHVVTAGDISAGVHGSGNLAEEGGQVIRLPEGVKLTEFYVPNYAAVKQGDKLAGVDRVTVMQAISKTQESMDYLKEQLNKADTGKGTVQIETETGGIVKAVYCKNGDEVGAVMMEHGALAVLSLDGLMAVKFRTDAVVLTGDSVSLRFADGSSAAAKVESALDGEVIVTVADESYPMDAEVTVLTADGVELGSGKLYVHNAWRAMGTTGTVSNVNIKENDVLKPDRRLMTLKDVDQSAKFAELSNKHRAYEQLMLELFIMYQNEAIVAPCDGIVTGVDRNSVHLLAADGEYEISLLANAPNGNDLLEYVNYLGKVALVDVDKMDVLFDTEAVLLDDYWLVGNLEYDTVFMTKPMPVALDVPVYELKEGVWLQMQVTDIKKDDVLLFAVDTDDRFVWAIRVPEKQPDVIPNPTPEVTPNPDGTLPGEDFVVDDFIIDDFIWGGGGGGMYIPPEPPEMFDLEGTDILTVTPQETMTLTIGLNEQDVGKVSMGQTAQVKVGVMKGKLFEGKVTSIYSKTDEQERLKFYVEVTLQREGDMLNGMSATAIFTGASAEQALLIPVAALNAKGARTVVYTAVSGDEPAKPVEVTTGISDGELVEVTAGLTEGQTIYYEYYEAQEVSNAVGGRGGLFW